MKKIVQVGYCTDDSEVFNGRRVNFKIDEDEQLIGCVLKEVRTSSLG
jgi:hypothetical protein